LSRLRNAIRWLPGICTTTRRDIVFEAPKAHFLTTRYRRVSRFRNNSIERRPADRATAERDLLPSAFAPCASNFNWLFRFLRLILVPWAPLRRIRAMDISESTAQTIH
jgi:hypothetical protein